MNRVLVGLIASLLCHNALAQEESARDRKAVDTALIVSVDVSGSVDNGRYVLQMDGIARALEDPEVQAAMLSGPHHRLAFSMVQWSDRPLDSISWTVVASPGDAAALAAQVRATRRPPGEFTCLADMMRHVHEVTLPDLPFAATRVVMDVSGDGVDNCDDGLSPKMRDTLVASGLTINGLPVNEGDSHAPVGGGAYRAPGRPFQPREIPTNFVTLESWYRKNVIGGPGAFLLPAKGFGDFGRAIKQKFVAEVSSLAPSTPSRLRND